ncbi:hypothetical protein X011_03085 [Mycobacterium tuberculosis variant microti OV254]|nr:hypothetical protein X011_03085 [Mycobacterium tuberculosis variant microti OV254]
MKTAGGTVAVMCATIAWLAGCGHSGDSTATSTSSMTAPSSTTVHTTWTRPDTPPDPHNLIHAGSVALGAVPGGKLTSIKSQETGTWRVLVATPDGANQAMDVSSDGATLMVGPTPANQDDSDKAKTRALVQAARLDYRTAAEKILSIIAGARSVNSRSRTATVPRCGKRSPGTPSSSNTRSQSTRCRAT